MKVGKRRSLLNYLLKTDVKRYREVVKSLGLRNSLWALIIPSAINTFNMIMLRSAFDNVPESLIEQADLEGANDFIMLALVVCLTLPLLYSIWSINRQV